MKKRSTHAAPGHGPEFKGVVKKMAGQITSNPGLEQEGRAEMRGSKPSTTQKPLNPDPHRRG